MEASFADLMDHELADRRAERDAAAAVAPTQNLLALIKPANDLTLEQVNVSTLAVAAMGDWRTSVKIAVDTLTGVEHDLSTQSKVDEAKSLRFRLIGKPVATLRKEAKTIRSTLSAAGKAVTASEEAAITAFDAAETLITPQIEAAEVKLEAERQERSRIEAARVAKHQAGLDGLKAYLGKAAGSPSAVIINAIRVLTGMVFEKKDWEEFVPQAMAAREATVLGLQALLTETLTREAREAAAEALRIENEHQAAELAKQRAALEEERRVFQAQQQAEAKRLAEIVASAKATELAAAPTPPAREEKPLEQTIQPVAALVAAAAKTAPKRAAPPELKHTPAPELARLTYASTLAAKHQHATDSEGLSCFTVAGLARLIDEVIADVRAAAK